VRSRSRRPWVWYSSPSPCLNNVGYWLLLLP
jgi:hypothetical protein